MEQAVREQMDTGTATPETGALMSATKKRRRDDGLPHPSRGSEGQRNGSPQGGPSNKEDQSQKLRRSSAELLLEGSDQSGEESPHPSETLAPEEMKKQNAELLELVHELEAHLMDEGRPVQKSQWSESIEASKQRLTRYKRKKQKIAALSKIEVQRKHGGVPAGSLPANTNSTLVVSPSVWSQGVFSSQPALGGLPGGQGLPPIRRTGEETPVSELKQVEGQKPQEEQRPPAGKPEEHPASSGSGKASRGKGDEVERGMEGSAPQRDESLAKLVAQKEEEIESLHKELQQFWEANSGVPETPKGAPPTPRDHPGTSASAQGAHEQAAEDLSRQLKEALAENQQLQEAVMVAHAKVEWLEARIATLEGIISKKDVAHNDLMQKLESTSAQLSRPGSERGPSDSDGDFKKEVQHLREALDIVRAVEGELRRQSAEKDARITAAASIVEQLKQATEQLQDEKKLKEADSMRLLKENGELNAQVAEAMRLLNAQEESIASLQMRLRPTPVPAVPVDSPEAQAARSILEVAKDFNVRTIDKLKVELQKARLVESLEAALQQSIEELSVLRRGAGQEGQSKPPEGESARVRELESALLKYDRDLAVLRQEAEALRKERRKSISGEEENLQKQLNTKTRELEDLSKDLQASYVQHSKVQRMLELLREANIGSVEKLRVMIKRHQQFDSLEAKSRALEGENASMQRKLKRAHDSPTDVADSKKGAPKKDIKLEGSQGTPVKINSDDNSREDLPIAAQKLVKTGSIDVDKPEQRTKEGGREDAKEFFSCTSPGALAVHLVSQPQGEAEVQQTGVERVAELEKALVEQKHRADRLEARLKKGKGDGGASASESQAFTAMVRALGLESSSETGLLAIEKALQTAAQERESTKRELEGKREEVELIGRRLRELSQRNGELEGAASEVATLQIKLVTSQSMLQQLQRRNRSLLMDAAAAQAVLELLRGPYVRDVGQLQLLLERAIELSMSEKR